MLNAGADIVGEIAGEIAGESVAHTDAIAKGEGRTRLRLVIIGNGMSCLRLLENLLELAPHRFDRFEIQVFGAEPEPAYNRIQLSALLSDEASAQDILLQSRQWYAAHAVHLHTQARVLHIDRQRRCIQVQQAQQRFECGYDLLVIATGSLPLMPALPGIDLPGVLAYRDVRDTQDMMDAAAQYRQAVVIGGGLLGLEAANGLQRRGMQVTLVHRMSWLMERQLDAPAAALLQQALSARGIRFRLDAVTECLLPAAAQPGDAASGDTPSGDTPPGDTPPRVATVCLADGERLPAQLVVVAIGIRPDMALAQQAGLHCQRGIVVNDHLQSSDPGIYALGECAEHRGICYGLVAPLYEQAAVLARQLQSHLRTAPDTPRYAGSLLSTRLKVAGMEVFSAGQIQAEAGDEELILSDPQGGVYRKLVLRDDRLRGAVLFGDSAGAAQLLDCLLHATPLGMLREQLLCAA